MIGDQAASESPARGPLCPNCREPLRSNLRQEQVIPEGGTAVAVTYCGACGSTLACAPASTRGPMQFQQVAAPADERTPEGQFHLRCRELIGEIRSLGFEPNVWVAMINDLGAAAAARKLLADHHQLVVTPWLVRRGRPELTLEHEIGQPGWAGLFTDAERDEAARRLARAKDAPGAMSGRDRISALRWRALLNFGRKIPVVTQHRSLGCEPWRTKILSSWTSRTARYSQARTWTSITRAALTTMSSRSTGTT